MTDKDKIREKVEELQEQAEYNYDICTTQHEMQFWLGEQSVLTKLKEYIDSLQEKPIKDRFVFKAIPRLLDMIEPTDKAKSYVAKLADAFDSEGYYTDAKIVRESLKIMNDEKVPMATMDEEPVRDELEEFARANANKEYPPEYEMADDNWKQRAGYVKGFKAGAKWKEEQMIANTADAMIGLPYENKDGGYTHLIDVSRPLPVGNNKIAIIFKEG